LLGAAGAFGGLDLVYSAHTLMVSQMNARTFANVAIIGSFALVMIFYVVFTLSIRIGLAQSQLCYRSLFGASVIELSAITSVSRFSGRGASFLKIRSEEKSVTISTYSFSSKDLKTINDTILARRGAILEQDHE
jgi:hypothetical protein